MIHYPLDVYTLCFIEEVCRANNEVYPLEITPFRAFFDRLFLDMRQRFWNGYTK